MRKKTKLVSMVLVTIMFMGLISACSFTKDEESQSLPEASTSTNTPASSQDDITKDPFEIAIAMPIFGPVPEDIQLVQDEISKITKQKINATVKLLPISIGAYVQQMNLMNSSGEKLDMYIALGPAYNMDVASGKYIELDGLLEKYGQDLKSQFDPAYLTSARINEKLYGVPALKDYTTGVPGVAMRKDLVEKYKIDLASIQSLDDLDQVFKTIKDNEPNITPLGIGLSGPMYQYVWYDKLGDSFGVLPNYDNGLKVENLYESQEYTDTLNTLHRWFKAGYINKDAATNMNNPGDMIKANKTFAFFMGNKPDALEGNIRSIGKDLVFAPVKQGDYSTTSDILFAMWGISANSANPERTMMFMNLLYSDPTIANLMLYGVEGKHYVKVSSTSIDYPSGINAATVGYTNYFWVVGNPFITFTFEGQPVDHWVQIKQTNTDAIKSKALGFSFNSDPVKTEITALNNVLTQFAKILESGTVAPADKIEEFNTKLKAAGIEKVIAEKQKQLDEWAASDKSLECVIELVVKPLVGPIITL
ncbi:ABC transporter substrate-binding protein [Paenibacillus sinopodophylli]|uniref:ABC transporter substrate-binding protein n=1 Tax=Paenibacillus sinopodophylli TaxID=1837342 RepID=UPI00110CEBBB|nr:ABC transporter substrate-binding protein [Paenibacillus sinopodophylli]